MSTDLEGAVERFTLDLIEIEDHINAERVRLVQHSDDDWSVRYLGDLAKDGRTILDALASITRERDAMLEGLKPFAARIVDIGVDEDDGDRFSNSLTPYSQSLSVKVGHIRRAAALVNGEVGK